MNKGITVHAKDECICGQVHEVVYHISDGGFDVRTHWPKPTRDAKDPSILEVKPEHTLEFSGKYGKVDLNGVKWEGNEGIICAKCGINLMYGLVAEVEHE